MQISPMLNGGRGVSGETLLMSEEQDDAVRRSLLGEVTGARLEPPQYDGDHRSLEGAFWTSDDPHFLRRGLCTRDSNVAGRLRNQG